MSNISAAGPGSPPPTRLVRENASHSEPAHEQQAEAAQQTAPQFVNPVTKVDPHTGIAVLVVRDSSNGEELEQYPSRQVVEEYRSHMHSPSPAPVQAGEAGVPVSDAAQAVAAGTAAAPRAPAPPAPARAPSSSVGQHIALSA